MKAIFGQARFLCTPSFLLGVKNAVTRSHTWVRPYGVYTKYN